MGMRPIPNNFPITQNYKQNLTTFNYGIAHGAIDFGCPIGTPVVAIEDGIVEFDGWVWDLPATSWEARRYLIRPAVGDTKTGGGISTILNHGGYESIDCHMHETYFNKGDFVRKGQVIGLSGNTGSSTGPHLHLAVLAKPFHWTNGFYGGVDPAPFITEPYKPLTDVNDNKTTNERALNGIDVSEYQPADIISKVQADFVIVKATEGVGWQSKYFKQQLTEARRKGLKVGVYHYARPGSNSSESEARYFYNIVRDLDSPDLVWFLDWEEEPFYSYTAWATDFMAELDRLTGKTTGLYANTAGLATGVWPEKDMKRPVWRAFPVLSNTGYATSFNLPALPGRWSTLVMDQYSFYGRLPGYSGDLDLNVYYGGIQQWGAIGSATITKEWDEMASKEEIKSVVASVWSEMVGPLANKVDAITRMLESTGVFKDVAPGHVFEKEIIWAKEKGVLKGYGNGTFKPDDRVYRDQLAVVLYRLAGSPEYIAPEEPIFIDVPKDHVFYKEICWLQSKGISGGWNTAEGKVFRPTDPVNKDQMAAFLYRLAGSPEFTPLKESPFADVPTTHHFFTPIVWTNTVGIELESDDRSFHPTQPVTRDLLAALVYRYVHHVKNYL